MSVELTSYMSQYASLTAEITSSISKIGRLNSEISENTDIDGVSEQDEKLKNIIGQVEKSFEDAEELFEQMELEIRELVDQAERTKHTTNLQSFKVTHLDIYLYCLSRIIVT
jgi:chromosome segregation ATPase